MPLILTAAASVITEETLLLAFVLLLLLSGLTGGLLVAVAVPAVLIGVGPLTVDIMLIDWLIQYSDLQPQRQA